MKLVEASEGRICARYYKRPDGNIITATSQQLHQIKRRASRIAAGAFTAALSLSASVSAQTTSPTGSNAPANREIEVRLNETSTTKQDAAAPSLAGTITDPNGAVIPAASVTIVNDENNQEQKTTSNDEGYFSFQYLDAGAYTIRVEAQGFKLALINNVLVRQSGEQSLSATVEVNATLEAGGETALMGVVSITVPRVPIIAAAARNDLEAVRYLINAGVLVNLVDEDTDTTALSQAVQNNNLKMVQVLLAAGAEVNAKNSHGQTALMSLGDDSTDEMVWTLVSAGARINYKDEDGNTVLMSVAGAENPTMLRALIDAGAKVNARNEEGETALMIAARRGATSSVKVLIMAGADLNITDNKGHTALQLTQENDTPDMVELLEAYGAQD